LANDQLWKKGDPVAGTKRYPKKCQCARCGAKSRELSQHHILPKRHFLSSRAHPTPTIFLCKKCHAKLEDLIPMRLQEEEFYYQVVEEFLGVDRLRLMTLTRQRGWQIEIRGEVTVRLTRQDGVGLMIEPH